MDRQHLSDYLDSLLPPAAVDDYCPNGLQVEGRAKVHRLVTGVTASQALIDAAVAELGPTTDLLDSRAMVRLAKGQSRQALEDVSDAILLQPTPRNFLHLAVIQAALGDLEGAGDALATAREKALDEERLSPDDRRRLEKVEAAIKAGVRAP
jgi:hypothetical protein